MADLAALSMVRELGAILTALVFAGGTGSAFAAEIDTMKVNEEVNALETMGIDPMRLVLWTVSGSTHSAPAARKPRLRMRFRRSS